MCYFYAGVCRSVTETLLFPVGNILGMCNKGFSRALAEWVRRKRWLISDSYLVGIF
jgi:hypothetical protein